MVSPDAGRVASARLSRAGWFLHAYVVETKLCALRDAVENKYNANQPRVPAGNSDGGQWTGGGGGTGGRLPSSLVGRPSNVTDRIRLAQNTPRGHLSDVTPRPKKLPRDIQTLSDIPREKPSVTQVANAIIKFVAYEAADYLMRQGERPLAAGAMRTRVFRRLLIGFDVALWVRDEGLPAIESYYDPPRTLEELRDAAASRRPGYEIHHIVERNSASPKEGNRINASENLVSIPVFKHHLITGYYMKRNDAYQRKRLRDALRHEDWETRRQEGLEALVKYGVMKP